MGGGGKGDCRTRNHTAEPYSSLQVWVSLHLMEFGPLESSIFLLNLSFNFNYNLVESLSLH